MAVRQDILQFPHPSLSTPTSPWKFSIPLREGGDISDDVPHDPGLWELFEVLEASMPADALALAANQVGLPHRIFLLSRGVCDKTLLPRLIVNPERLSDAPWPGCNDCLSTGSVCRVHGAWLADDEGCLSFAGVGGRVVRPVTARFGFYDILGNRRELSFMGLPARVFLHETEHLDGRTFLDGMSPEHRSKIRVRMLNRRKKGM